MCSYLDTGRCLDARCIKQVISGSSVSNQVFIRKLELGKIVIYKENNNKII